MCKKKPKPNPCIFALAEFCDPAHHELSQAPVKEMQQEDLAGASVEAACLAGGNSSQLPIFYSNLLPDRAGVPEAPYSGAHCNSGLQRNPGGQVFPLEVIMFNDSLEQHLLGSCKHNYVFSFSGVLVYEKLARSPISLVPLRGLHTVPGQSAHIQVYLRPTATELVGT